MKMLKILFLMSFSCLSLDFYAMSDEEEEDSEMSAMQFIGVSGVRMNRNMPSTAKDISKEEFGQFYDTELNALIEGLSNSRLANLSEGEIARRTSGSTSAMKNHAAATGSSASSLVTSEEGQRRILKARRKLGQNVSGNNGNGLGLSIQTPTTDTPSSITALLSMSLLRSSAHSVQEKKRSRPKDNRVTFQEDAKEQDQNFVSMTGSSSTLVPAVYVEQDDIRIFSAAKKQRNGEVLKPFVFTGSFSLGVDNKTRRSKSF